MLKKTLSIFILLLAPLNVLAEDKAPSFQELVEEVEPLIKTSVAQKVFEKNKQRINTDISANRKKAFWSVSGEGNLDNEFLSNLGRPAILTLSGKAQYQDKNGFSGSATSSIYDSPDLTAAGIATKNKISVNFSQEVIQAYKRPSIEKLKEEKNDKQLKSELHRTDAQINQQYLDILSTLLNLYHDHCLKKDLAKIIEILNTAFDASKAQVNANQISMKDHLSTVNLRDKFNIQSANLSNQLIQNILKLQKYSFEIAKKAKRTLDRVDACDIPEVLDEKPFPRKMLSDGPSAPLTDDINSIMLQIDAQQISASIKETEQLASLKPYVGLERVSAVTNNSYNQLVIGFTFNYVLDNDRNHLEKKSELESLQKLNLELLNKQESNASRLNELAFEMDNSIKIYQMIMTGHKNSLVLLDILKKQSSLGLTDTLAQVNAYTNWYERISEIRSAIRNYGIAKYQYRYLLENKVF